MSREIEVWADWRELGVPMRMGHLRATPSRGKEVFSFSYDRAWLDAGHSRQLDPDLQLFSGPQYLSATDRPNFGLFLDSSPDRWGRLLMQRREAALAREEGRASRRLLETVCSVCMTSSAPERSGSGNPQGATPGNATRGVTESGGQRDRLRTFYLYFQTDAYHRASMHPEPTPDDEAWSATPEERRLLQQLRANPLLSEQFKSLADRFEDEISNGMDAHQAEAALVESLQQLGRGLMHQWAENTQRKLVGESRELRRHAKKNSGGTPPSV